MSGTPQAAEKRCHGDVKPKIGEHRRHLLVCTGPRCGADGASEALFDSLGENSRQPAVLETSQMR